MPIRRRYNRRRPRKVRRQGRRTHRSRKMKASITKMPGLFLADRMFLRMPFTLTYNVPIVASSALNIAYFSGTNINDPSGIIGGVRPIGWTQYSALYQNFKVYASKITVKFMSSQDPTLPSVMRVALFPLGNPGTPFTGTSIDQMASQKYARWKVYNATTSFPTLKGVMGTAKINGFNREAVRDEATSFTGTFANVPAGPTIGFEWAIGVQPLAVTTTNVNVQVKVVYSVELFNRQQLLQV